MSHSNGGADSRLPQIPVMVDVLLDSTNSTNDGEWSITPLVLDERQGTVGAAPSCSFSRSGLSDSWNMSGGTVSVTKSPESGSDCVMPKHIIENMKRETASHGPSKRGSWYSAGEIRMAKRGVISKDSITRLSGEAQALRTAILGDFKDDGDEEEDDAGLERTAARDGSRSDLGGRFRCPEGEIRMAQLGCLSRKSAANFRRRGLINRVSFSDDGREEAKECRSSYATDAPIEEVVKEMHKVNDEAKAEELVKQPQDILTEGQYYLGISMLVYMYSHLRETCRMGHTRVRMEDIDVNSLQSQYNRRDVAQRRYLSFTKTAGSIIRVLIDELEHDDDDDEEHDIVGDENKEYEKSITAQFVSWIQDSRVKQLDEGTERMIAKMRRQVARHRWKRAIMAVRLSYKLSGGKAPRFDNPVLAPGCENQNRFVDMKDVVRKAIKANPKYFREGSVMHNLIESGIEMVWFSDMSQNDVVYGICIERKMKKVTVVFRGTVNSHNWKMNLKFDTNEYRNPIKQQYPCRSDELSLHSGFALYLLRRRKDTGQSKLQEIFDKIEEIGRELAPDDGKFHLSITGHSLGGALATLFGFYAAARPRFAHLGTIYIWTFAAPRVGTRAFIHAWKYLERTGRIRHARFSVTQDLVPLVPFCNFEWDDLQFYKHVGMRVSLHGIGWIGKRRLKRNLDVSYPLHHDWRSEIRRMFMNNIFANLTTLTGFKNNHKLTEYHKRLHFAMSYRKALGSGVYFSDNKRNRIKSLDEYYYIRANITSDVIPRSVLEQSKTTIIQKDLPQPIVLLIVFLLLMAWAALISSVTSTIFEINLLPLEIIQSHCSLVSSMVFHMIHLPATLPMAIYETLSLQTGRAVNFFFRPPHMSRAAFISRKKNPNLNDLINELAVRRTNHYMATQHKALTIALGSNQNGTQLKIFDSTAKSLYNLAALVDDGSNPPLAMFFAPIEDEQANLKESDVNY